MNKIKKSKIGLFGIGLDTYWPQFEGLKEGLTAYLEVVGDTSKCNYHA